MTDSSSHSDQQPYQVLARKYRPQSFADLLGHDAMVRTLRNAFDANRVAHAWILTGVRGVGKTTTARILARALNYAVEGGPDAPSIDMAEQGIHCQAIAESRHPDVIEMDAASRTGVDDIRELIESVRYAPVQARYKVYIIDEVHMLSKNAFNALLKTLEEPPTHVKFIFATTEIRKVPVTVLSRCQRFDLRRFDQDTLADYLGGIVEKESAKVDRDGLLMIARAAEGSVRDALSLLDQAIIQHHAAPEEAVSAEQVQDMLGLANRYVSWDILDACLKGEAPKALELFRGQYNCGADPLVVLRDLLELVHLLTRVKAAGEGAASHGSAGTAEATRAKEMAAVYALNGLTRAWSLLMKGLQETQSAPDAAASAEMALIRLCYAADLPTLDEALRQLNNTTPKSGGGGQTITAGAGGNTQAVASVSVGGSAQSGPVAQRKPSPLSAPQSHLQAANETRFETVADLANLAGVKRDAKLREEIEKFVRIVKLEPGRIEFNPAPGAPEDLSGRLAAQLKNWTGERWVVSVNARAKGGETLRNTRNDGIRAHPLIQAALEVFPEIDADRDMRIKEIEEFRPPDENLIEDDES
ncbi:DNA polymerase III subunit gamma/tau [Parvularcula sp. IMCC14364]|uniref:DNA polymerase III subunit gamma/tau n=1 Tax=Parvularcula sp. IMCC14364 TaxID=3067902 RepID=UPI0027427AEE|nr:DNA polymerase III subunit gamma/tau [Parvularcula sp. IMCC14364]